MGALLAVFVACFLAAEPRARFFELAVPGPIEILLALLATSCSPSGALGLLGFRAPLIARRMFGEQAPKPIIPLGGDEDAAADQRSDEHPPGRVGRAGLTAATSCWAGVRGRLRCPPRRPRRSAAVRRLVAASASPLASASPAALDSTGSSPSAIAPSLARRLSTAGSGRRSSVSMASSLRLLTLGDERDGRAVAADAAGAADAVHVDLGLVGQLVVDDVADVRDVEAARRDVGRHEQPARGARGTRSSPSRAATGSCRRAARAPCGRGGRVVGEARRAELGAARRRSRSSGCLGLEQLLEPSSLPRGSTSITRCVDACRP